MEREGVVSLWIGTFNSDKDMEKYVSTNYTDDGEYLPSNFLSDFKIHINDFDEDFIERIFEDINNTSIEKMLMGCSYDLDVIPKFKTLFKEDGLRETNAAILLYNFQYSGKVEKINGKSYKLKYVGNFELNKAY